MRSSLVENLITEVKEIIQKAYGVADELDNAGIKAAPRVFDSTRDAMQIDLQMMIFRIQMPEEIITDECRRFLNECLEQRYTPITVEIAKKRIMEGEIRDLSLVLPFMILADAMLGIDLLVKIYLRTISMVLCRYMNIESRLPIDMIVNYARLMNAYMRMIEEATGEPLAFDPMECIDVKEIPFFDAALDADRKIHADEWNGPFANQKLKDVVREAKSERTDF